MGVYKLKTGPSYKLKTGPSYKLKIGPSFFLCFPRFYSVFGAFLETQIVQQCVKMVFLQNFGDVKNEVFEKKIAFFCLFYIGEREKQKKEKKMEKAQKTL